MVFDLLRPHADRVERQLYRTVSEKWLPLGAQNASLQRKPVLWGPLGKEALASKYISV